MTWCVLHFFILLINKKPRLPGILVYCYGGSRARNSRGSEHKVLPALPGEAMYWFWGFQHAESVPFSELWPSLFNNRFLASKNHTMWFRLQGGNDAYVVLLKYMAIQYILLTFLLYMFAKIHQQIKSTKPALYYIGYFLEIDFWSGTLLACFLFLK